MSIQILPENPSVGSAIGAGVAKGISTQLPEEIKRYRLQSGLEQLGKNLDPNAAKNLKLISSLATIPGLDPNLMGVLAPLLQNTLAVDETLGQGQLSGNTGQLNQQGQPLAQSEQQQTMGQPQQANTFALGISPREALRDTLLRTQRLNNPNPTIADKNASDIIGRAEGHWDEFTKSYLQKDKELQQGEIGGRVWQNLKQQGLEELALNPRDETGIMKRKVEEAYKITRDKRSMRDVHDDWGLKHQKLPDQGTLDSLRGLTQSYLKNKIPIEDLIDDMATTQNISKGAAEYIINPSNHIHIPTKEAPSIKALLTGKGPKEGNLTEEALAKQLAGKIKPDDLIGSIIYKAQSKGYNGEALRVHLQRLLDPNKLTQQQAIDLRNRVIPVRRGLDEAFLMGWSGEGRRAKARQ